MLKSIKLKGFQSHKDSEINFSDGFNLIIGASNNGKSAILKAFEWIRTNRPLGKINAFDKDNISVFIDINGNVIERTKTEKSTGFYRINNNDNQKYSVMKGIVPDVISNIMNLTDINVQSQLDQHFLILDTAGIVCSKINELTGLDRVINAISYLKNNKAQATKNIESIDFEINNIKKYLESGVIDQYEKLKILYNRLAELIDKQFTMNQQIYSIDVLSKKIFDIEKQLIKYINLKKLNRLCDSMYGSINKITELGGIIEDIDYLTNEIQETGIEIIRKATKINHLGKLVEKFKNELDICPYCGSCLTKETKLKLLRG